MKRLLFSILAICAVAVVDVTIAAAETHDNTISIASVEQADAPTCAADISLEGLQPGDGAEPMGGARAFTLETPASVAAGAAQVSACWHAAAWQLSGTFVATVALQGTLDGTNYQTIGSGLTAPAVTAVTASIHFAKIRANTTAFTSGVPAVTVYAVIDCDHGNGLSTGDFAELTFDEHGEAVLHPLISYPEI